MNTAELEEYEKIPILDIANNNYVANYINPGKKRFEQCMCQWGCDPFQ